MPCHEIAKATHLLVPAAKATSSPFETDKNVHGHIGNLLGKVINDDAELTKWSEEVQ